MSEHENPRPRACMPPLKLNKWIEENKEKLQPPIMADLFWEDSDFIIMAVGGPNHRSDYHVNQTDEFFYQYIGDMVLKVKEGNNFHDIHIREGEIYLHPGGVPHSPQRFSNTVGIVIEIKRKPESRDRLQWYCENPQTCRELLHEFIFPVNTLNLGVALKPLISEFYGNEKFRTCKKCGFVTPVPERNK